MFITFWTSKSQVFLDVTLRPWARSSQSPKHHKPFTQQHGITSQMTFNLQRQHYQNIKYFWTTSIIFQAHNFTTYCIKYFMIYFNSATHIRHLYEPQVKTSGSVTDCRSSFFSLMSHSKFVQFVFKMTNHSKHEKG